MKKLIFTLLILFSLFIPIQNSSAVSPSLDETLEFLVNGENTYESKWTIDDNCVLEIVRDPVPNDDPWLNFNGSHKIIWLNKVSLSEGVKWTVRKGKEIGFTLYGKEMYRDITDIAGNDKVLRNAWAHRNAVGSTRNLKALQHLFSNFCEGAKSTF
jgi:hypothetical protein